MVRRGVVARLALAAVLLVVAALAVVPRFVSWRSDNPIRRGQRIARREGCLNCHQAPFRGELGNPGSGTGSVPALGSGSLMMYVQRPEEVEEWIRDGQSRALAANPDDHQARFDLAGALAGQGRLDEAADHLLTLIARDQDWNDQAARKQLLTVFEAAGFNSEIAKQGRRRLSSILFS